MAKNVRVARSKPKPIHPKFKGVVKTRSQDVPPPSSVVNLSTPSKRSSLTDYKSKASGNEFRLSLTAAVYTVQLHQNYEVKEDHPLYKGIRDLFKLYIKKEQKRSKKVHTHIPFTYFPKFQFLLRGQKPQEDKCSICQFEYEQPQDYEEELVKESDGDIVSLSCSHLFHKECFYGLKGDKNWIRCPVCSTIFGEMTGDQPPGTMTWIVNKLMECDGYPGVGTIVIDYNMHGGKQGSVSFPGTHRAAYLPNNEAGNEVLQLLRTAFDRKLVFTVGRSVTTGRDNQIVWNGIHHKTSTSGGSAYFGYPDASYFDRVKLELAAKGVL